MLTDNEKKFGFIEIGESEKRVCMKCGKEIWLCNSWPIWREKDYFTYRVCTCGQHYKILESIPNNLYFMGEIPTNIKGVKND